ncbi:hypothetical protein AAF712_015070 [Marasmius tenuissimus]|uniref:Proteophosphoglycan ppg4 n=1 Tax=Marasmius tenuissimus TaxID=585030 RepID=A0ABR2ZAM3_9AGAR
MVPSASSPAVPQLTTTSLPAPTRQRYTSLPQTQKPQLPSLASALPIAPTIGTTRHLRKPSSTPSMSSYVPGSSTTASASVQSQQGKDVGQSRLVFPEAKNGEETSASRLPNSQEKNLQKDDQRTAGQVRVRREQGGGEEQDTESGKNMSNSSLGGDKRPSAQPRSHENQKTTKTGMISMGTNVRDGPASRGLYTSPSTSHASTFSTSTSNTIQSSSSSSVPLSSSLSTPATTPPTSPPQPSAMPKWRAENANLPAIDTVPSPRIVTTPVESAPRLLPEAPPLKTLKGSLSNSSLRSVSARPLGPRSPISPRTPLESPRATTPLALSSSPSLPSPPRLDRLESNQSFSSLISIYTSNNHGHGHSPSMVSTVSTSSAYVSPSPSEQSTDTRYSRYPAPAPGSIFGLGMLGGSERSTSGLQRKPIPSFADSSDSGMGTEAEGEIDKTAGRKEKGLSSATVRDHSRDAYGGMVDADGRTVGEDPRGTEADVNATPRKSIASSGFQKHESIPENPRTASPIPPSASLNSSQSRSAGRRASQPLAPLSIPHLHSQPRFSPERNSSSPQVLRADDMKRLLSKPAVFSGYSSASDSDRRPVSPVLMRTVPSSPRRRVASNSDRPQGMDKGYKSASEATSRKPIAGPTDWVAPWDIDGEDNRGLVRSTSLKKVSNDKEGKGKEKEKKPRNVLRKASFTTSKRPSSPSGKLQPPLSGSSTRSPSPTARRGESSGGSSPALSSAQPMSPAIRTPAEEIKMAYKQQVSREIYLEKTVDEGKLAGKKNRYSEELPRRQPALPSPTARDRSSSKTSTPVTAASNTEPSAPSSTRNGRTEPVAPRTPRTPIGPKTGVLVAVGSEEDSFLPSFSTTPNFASQLSLDDEPSPPSFQAGRPSLQERRTSLKRPFDANGMRLSLDPPRRKSTEGGDYSLATPRTPLSADTISSPSPGAKNSKGGGGLWGLMKKFSGAGLRDKYVDNCDGEAPPVPALPNGIARSKLAQPSSVITSMGSVDEGTFTPVRAVRPRRSLGETRPRIISNSNANQVGSSSSSTTVSTSVSTRPNTTTCSSSPSSSFVRPGESRTSHSSYGDERPPLPPSKTSATSVLEQRILSPSELSRLEFNFDLEYDRKQRSKPTVTRPPLSSIPTTSSTDTAGRSSTSGASRNDWTIVHTPADETPPFSLPLPPYRKPRSASPSTQLSSRPSTAPGPPPSPTAAVKNSRKTSIAVVPTYRPSLPYSTSDDDHGTVGSPPHLESPTQGRKSTSSVPKPSSRIPPSRFRELSRTNALTEEEKAERWDDLLLKSDLAGGTLHLRGTERLESDRISVLESDAEHEQ